MRPAAFLDRDGTLIEEAHFLADPERVTLVPGAVAGMRSLAAAGFPLVIVTNQSGIARGLYTEADFHAVQARLESMLKAQGVAVALTLFCPHHPDFSGPCECRKPGLGMYRIAARALDLDLARSIYVGDRVKDVLPALATGGRGYLVRSGYGREEAQHAPPGVTVAVDLLEVSRLQAGVDTSGGDR